jgi:hypothetical protein
MNSRRLDRECSDNDMDCLIYWALHDAVADARPSPQVWERVQQRIADDAGVVALNYFARCGALLWRLLDLWLNAPVPRDLSKRSWQQRTLARALVAEPGLLHSWI